MKINEKTIIKFSTSNSVPSDLEGYLFKRGDTNKNMQKRWCVLRGNMLFYFEKRSDKEPLGCILLEGSRVELADKVEMFAFKIVFVGSDRDYIFATDNPESLENWMKAVSQASYSYLKMVVSELQRQLDDMNLAERRKLVQNEELVGDKTARVNPFNVSNDNLIDLDDANSAQARKTLFSRKPFIEVHQYYGLQFRNYLQRVKSEQKQNTTPKQDLLS